MVEVLMEEVRARSLDTYDRRYDYIVVYNITITIRRMCTTDKKTIDSQ